MFVRDGDNVPRGNKELLKLGATALRAEELTRISDLSAWTKNHTPPDSIQQDLFDPALRERSR